MARGVNVNVSMPRFESQRDSVSVTLAAEHAEWLANTMRVEYQRGGDGLAADLAETLEGGLKMLAEERA